MTAMRIQGFTTAATAAGIRYKDRPDLGLIFSEVPATAPTPVITALEVDGDIAVMAVADTVSYLTYTVSSSETLAGFSRDKYADKVDGDASSEIVLGTDAPSDTRFFRITRAE